MKTFSLIAIVTLIAVAAYSQPGPRPFMPPPPSAPPAAAPAKELVNYLVRVEWKDSQGAQKFLEVLTAEGAFELDTIQKNSVKINNNDVPVTLKFNGTINNVTDDKARLQMFLGRTVPYVTGSTYGGSASPMSTYSQMSVGLQSTFVVTFGKPVVIQNDENGEISVLVKRMD